MAHTPQTILALDPGLRELGYVVLSGSRLSASGVVPLKLLPRPMRAPAARLSVNRWIDQHRPDVLVLERVSRHPVGSLNDLHRFTVAVERLARRRRLPVATYHAQTVRKGLLADGWAPKHQVAEYLAARYPALRIHLHAEKRWKVRYWQNLFDALALAVHHRATSRPH
jgi:Holliday junction resolvasome RuvABC endonuclease subunit